jgi:hypothetical protein
MQLIPIQVKYFNNVLLLFFIFFLLGKLNRDKQHSVNKIGHALHTLEPQFKRISFSDKIKVKKKLNEF